MLDVVQSAGRLTEKKKNLTVHHDLLKLSLRSCQCVRYTELKCMLRMSAKLWKMLYFLNKVDHNGYGKTPVCNLKYFIGDLQ